MACIKQMLIHLAQNTLVWLYYFITIFTNNASQKVAVGLSFRNIFNFSVYSNRNNKIIINYRNINFKKEELIKTFKCNFLKCS